MFHWHYCPVQIAYLRLLHASPDAPSVDVYANNNLLVRDLAFGILTNYFCLTPGPYRITVYPTGTQTNPLIDTTVTLANRTIATAAIIGMLADISLQVIPEPPVIIPYQNAAIRAIHLSPNTPNIDVTQADGTILFQNISYTTVTSYVAVTPGEYTLQLRLAGTDQILLAIPNVYLSWGRTYSVYAIGLQDGTPPLQAIVALDGNSYIMP
jgi:hypothetical protein